MSVLFFQKWISEINGEVPDEVIGGYCCHTCLISEYLKGTTEGGKWSCVIDRKLIRMVVMFD
jgi:hypothetical protein